jgi:hypothetical protein
MNLKFCFILDNIPLSRKKGKEVQRTPEIPATKKRKTIRGVEEHSNDSDGNF